MRLQYLLLFQDGDPLISEIGAALSRQIDPNSEIIFVDSTTLPSARWKHYVSSTEAHSVVTLNNGSVLDSRMIAGGVNRLQFVSGPLLSTVADTKYAQAEFHALLLSWLHSLPGRWMNPVSARGLSGAVRSWLEWSRLARCAGLSVVPFRVATRKPLASRTSAGKAAGLESRVVVVGDRVFGGNHDLRARCHKLGTEAGCSLLAFQFNDSWQLCGIEPNPATLSPQEVQAAVEWIGSGEPA